MAPRENSGGSLFLKSRSAEVQFSDLCKINCYYYYYYFTITIIIIIIIIIIDIMIIISVIIDFYCDYGMNLRKKKVNKMK